VPRLRIASFLLLATALTGAVDVPQGELPAIDGAVEEAEWKGATRLAADGGEAFVVAAGRVLCIGIRVNRPYKGERIDLQAADDLGKNYASHSFHPACTVPPVSLYPLAPVFVRRASYALRQQAPIAPPVSCLFRARVYTEADAWSAEIAVALEALDVSPVKPIVFTLDILHPAGETPPIVFAPTEGETPKDWQRLVASWPESAPSFLTLDEDRRRAFELSLSLETLALVMQRDPETRPVADAVDVRKNGKKIDEILAGLDACVAKDPLDFFALATRASLLRRANRIEAAWTAQEEMWRHEPGRESHLFAGIRRMILISAMRFEEAAAMRLPGRDRIALMAEAWAKEAAARELDKGLPRIAFETTRGRVTVELFERDAPKAAAHLLALADNGAFADAVFDEVTGAASARAAPKPAVRVEPEGTRRAWRGTISFAESGALRFHTGHDTAPAVGRIVEGMEAVDALDAMDRIRSAETLR
jgi:cyclophilin family peptidyl-prolyl cis-trans isomerase